MDASDDRPNILIRQRATEYESGMEARYYLTCLWPGLPELWWRGRLSAIPTAIAFALALNLMLVTRYLYPEWMAGGLVWMGFWIGVVAWGFCVVRSIRELPELIAPRRVSEEPDQFEEAHAAYLAGRWEEAESLLNAVLAIEPRDPPALLLLTGVYRHTDRIVEARLLVTEIGKLEVADRWWLEVAAEVRRIERIETALSEQAEEPAGQSGQPAEQSDENGAGSKTENAADLTDEPKMAA